jgi:peptidoglycan/LPS O-acetylase OafA/YrhL
MGLLRILLAISVLATHLSGKSILGFRLVHGDLAVQSFYMISGFYMALILNRKYRPGQYGLFLQQRCLRLMPVYWVILAINIIVAYFFYVPARHTHPLYLGWLTQAHVPNAWAMSWIAFANLFIIGSDSFFYTAVRPDTGSLYLTLDWAHQAVPTENFAFVFPVWSLGLEMLFYLLAPVLVRRSTGVQLAVVVGSILLRVGSSYWINIHSDLFKNRFFPFELAFFMGGSIAYQLYARYSGTILAHARAWQWARWIFYFIVVAYSRLPGADSVRYFLFIGLLFVMIPVLFALSKDIAWDRYVGELSYSFYLSHPVIIILTEALVTRLAPNHWGIAYLVICLTFSYLIYRLFEVKVDRWRESVFRRATQRRVLTASPGAD